MILANILSGVINPIATIFGWLLAAFYSFSHSYGVSIILLTLVTMVVVFPLTRKGTRSMMQMQLLQPELLKLRNRHKVQPGMAAQEKQEVRQKQQEEMMALYRENGVSPTGGCLPMFMQFPIFIVLYDTIRGMTKVQLVGPKVRQVLVSTPQYINQKTALYTSLKHSAGKLNSFGLNLASSVRTHQHSWVQVIPYVVVILIAVALQYVSIWQITNRNPAASQANPQMQAAQKFMPLIFVVFYIVLPAGVGIYFIVSSLFRVAQQEYMYKHDPHIVAAVQQLTQRKASDPTPAQPKKSIRQMLREAAGEGASRASLESTPREGAPSKGAKAGNRPTSSSNGRPQAKGQSRSTSARGGQPRNGQQRSGQQSAKGRQPGGAPRQGGATAGRPAAAGDRPQGAARKPQAGGRPNGGGTRPPAQRSKPADSGSPPTNSAPGAGDRNGTLPGPQDGGGLPNGADGATSRKEPRRPRRPA